MGRSGEAIGTAGGINLYAYCRNNPVNFVDPLGLSPDQSGDGLDDDPVVREYRNRTQQVIHTGRRAARDAEPAISGMNGCIDATAGMAAAGLTGFGEGSGGVGGFRGGGSGAQTVSGEGDSPSFIVTPDGGVFPIPTGATGPRPTQGPGMMFQGGSGGHGLDPRVTGVRVMDETPQHLRRVVYMNSQGRGQTVNPFTGNTIPSDDPWAHIPW